MRRNGSISRGSSHATPKERYQYTTSVNINNTRYKRIQSLIQNHVPMCAVSLLERREQRYIKAMNNNKTCRSVGQSGPHDSCSSTCFRTDLFDQNQINQNQIRSDTGWFSARVSWTQRKRWKGSYGMGIPLLEANETKSTRFVFRENQNGIINLTATSFF